MVLINEDGEVDMMIKAKSQKNTKSPVPSSMVTKPMISGHIINFFKPNCVKTWKVPEKDDHFAVLQKYK